MTPNRIVAGLLILLLAGPPLKANDKSRDQPATPAEQYQALEAEYEAAQKEFQGALRKAKTQQEREKVLREKTPERNRRHGA